VNGEGVHAVHQQDRDAPLRSIEGELILLIARNAERILPRAILGAGLMALILMLHMEWTFPLLWFAVLSLGLILRTRLFQRLVDDPRSDREKLRIVTAAFCAVAVVQSAAMGFAAQVSTGTAAVLTMYLVGMTAGMVGSTAGSRLLVYAYSSISLSAIALAWALLPDPDRGPIDRALFVVMTLLYAGVLATFADNARKVFEDSYRMRLQREDLNRRLSEALSRAESASRAKTRFLASASHDLRQPIHALSLFAGSLLLRELDRRSGAIAAQIDKAVRVLTSQLDGLLDISRLDAGVVEQSVCALDLGTLLAEMAEEYRPLAERKQLEIQHQCSETLTVRTDPLLLRRVLGNLISNAVKYTAIGTVHLSAEAVDRVRARVVVRDTGTGIPEAEQERVFEEFYQIGNPERDRAQGLGLGLAIVRRIVDLLDLRLTLRSTPGIGTEITLELPRVRDESLAIPGVVHDPKRAITRRRVLVIDDEEDVRLGMETLLEELGFSVRTAASTEGALDATRDFEPALVLADLRLRGEDSGLRAIDALRRLWPTLPALLISGDTAPERLREARDAGVELLHKPLQPGRLRDAIARVLG
jgi:signal transduction histidine kinase/CheY-like chemotaxis protein